MTPTQGIEERDGTVCDACGANDWCRHYDPDPHGGRGMESCGACGMAREVA